MPEPAGSDTGAASTAAGRPASEGDGEARGGRPVPGDGELDAALGELDGEILSERATILARRNENAGQRPTPASSGGAGDDGETPQAGGAEAEQAEGEMPSGPGRRAPRPTPARMPNLPVPPDVADATDDDVVCRQLREAAMQETDAALRDKLWDEYRRCRER